MKKILLTAAILVSLASSSQMKVGKIIYERITQTPTRVIAQMDPEIAAQIPKSRTDQYELMFANNKSLFQFIPSAAGEEGNSFSGNGFFVRMSGGNDISFHDFNSGTRIDQREVMDRQFLVSDSIKPGSWKLTDETKQILNYTVKKAIGQRVRTSTRMSMENGEMKSEQIQDTAVVIAWFTLQIPVSVGPDSQGQLPGAILELEINNGQTIYRAIEISTKVNERKIKAPSEGKKITAREFETEREKLMEEMRKNMPENGQIRIRS